MPKKDTSFLKKLGLEIRRRRKIKGWSQEKLAQEAELTFKHVSKIERGLTIPGITTVNRLANALETSLAEILEFTLVSKHKQNPRLLLEELLGLLKNHPNLLAEFAARLIDELRKSIRAT
ncbi:helix-turn-helix transcriptional regulator [candidate division WOR-3 bacterium]|nr:helix-turn-helix transcriptional regulator [candidate division WOR-3 bacterium]